MLEKVTETLKAPISFGKKNPWAIAALLVVAGIVFLRYSDTVKAKVLKEAPTSSIYRFLASLLGYTVAAFLVLSAGDAVASVVTGNGSALTHPQASGVVNTVLGVLGSIAGFCTLGYVAGMPSKNIAHHDARNGDNKRALSTTPAYWDLSYPLHRKGRSVFKATQIELRFNFNASLASTSSGVHACEFGRMIANAELELKNGVGVLFPSTTCSGQFLRIIMTPLCRKGAYGATCETNIPANGSESAVSTACSFSIFLCFTNASSANPSDTAIPLAMLEEATLSVTAKTLTGVIGEDVTVTALTCSAVTHVIEDKSPNANKIPALLCPTRYPITASSNQTTMTFKNVGKTAGPVGANTTNGSRIAHMVVQSKQSPGLEGATPIDLLTRYACQQLEQPTTLYINDFLSSMIGSLDRSNKAIAFSPDVASVGAIIELNRGATWPLFPGAEPNGVPQDSIAFFPVVVSGERVKTTQLPILNGNLDILLECSTPASSGQHILNGIEIRDLGPEVQRACAELLGGRYDATAKKATMDGKDPEKMVISGMASPVDFKGLPVQLQDS